MKSYKVSQKQFKDQKMVQFQLPAATSALDSSGKAKSCREALRALPQRPLELLPRPGNMVCFVCKTVNLPH